MSIPAPKNVHLLVYETFAEFEVAVLLTALRGTPHRLTTVGLGPDPVTSTGGLRVLPDVVVEDVDPTEVGARADELVVTDGHVVTAVGSAYLSFAEEVLRHLDGAAEAEPLTYFREPSLA